MKGYFGHKKKKVELEKMEIKKFVYVQQHVVVAIGK